MSDGPAEIPFRPDERQRIADVYGERARSLPAGYYSLFDPANLHRLQRRERATLDLLESHGIRDLSRLRICEVGCGAGHELQRLIGWGAAPENLAGVDLLEDRIAAARALLPAADLHVADARKTPYEDRSFDLVMQLTLFSSVLDPDIRLGIAREMVRLVKPGGAILWYDMRVVRPGRPLAAMGRAEIGRLFAGCRFDVRPHTLNPVISRHVCKMSWIIGDIISLLPAAKSHYLALIEPGS